MLMLSSLCRNRSQASVPMMGDAAPPSRRWLMNLCSSASLWLIIVAVSALLGMGRPVLVAADRPNILWLTSEDHGPQMGCYGDLNARTPNIDALAAKGMIFNRVWSCAPVCAPARTAIISGIYPSSSGGIHMRSMVPMPKGARMYPEYLRELGYYCTNNSKEDYNLIKPAKLWDDSSSRAHWRNRQANQPFFAIFNSTKSHESQIRTRPHSFVMDPARVRVPYYHPDTPEVRLDWAQYYDKVSEADADAGKIMQQLVDDGLWEETIIFYFGDHGSGMPRSKRWPCNSGLHVPLVVHFPKKWQHLAPAEYEAGAKSDRLVNFVDLAPTLLSILGIDKPAQMQGNAFAGPFQSEPPAYLFGQRGRMDERYDLVRSVTDGRYVYLRNYFPHVSQAQHVDYQFQTPTTRIWKELYDRGETTPDQSVFWETPKAVEELYDLRFDQDEVKNLAKLADYAEILERLRQANRQQILATHDVGFLPEGEMLERSSEGSPYDMARDEERYPLVRVLEAAEYAASDAPDAQRLLTFLQDPDSAVRYWGAMGFLIRGAVGFSVGKGALAKAVADPSPYVRIVAAQTLLQYGSDEEAASSREALVSLAPPEKNGVLVSMAALNAIEAVGKPAKPIFEQIQTMSIKGKSPDGRYDGYIPRMMDNMKVLYGLGDRSDTKRRSRNE
jgi:arylsulfatase A-like enzyme